MCCLSKNALLLPSAIKTCLGNLEPATLWDGDLYFKMVGDNISCLLLLVAQPLLFLAHSSMCVAWISNITHRTWPTKNRAGGLPQAGSGKG